MQETIRVTEEEFGRFRPLNGFVVLSPEQDVAQIMIAGKPFFYDGSYSPESNQRVVNRVVKVPDDNLFIDDYLSCEILLSEGSLVWVDYFAVLQGTRLIVEPSRVNPNLGPVREYVMVSYRNCYMGLDDCEGVPTYYMLNDYMLLMPQERISMNPLIPDPAKRSVSRRFYTVEQVPFYGSFQYLKDEYPPVSVKPGDIVFLRDGNQFKLEHAPHYLYDKKQHYVTRIEKVMAVVDSVDDDATVF